MQRAITILNAGAVFVAAILVMWLRRPDILTDAKLWAEDGTVWLAQAYNMGPLQALFRPHTGYLQTFSRAVFGVATLLPLEHAAIFANLMALAVRAAVVCFFVSARFAWVDWRARLLLVAYYLLMPNISAVHANVTNTHWYLGLYLLLVILAEPPRSLLGKVHDYTVLVVAGLSGPFILFALPCLAVKSLVLQWSTWNGWRKVVLPLLTPFNAIAAVLGALQLVLILSGLGTRPTAPLGASMELLGRIISGRIVLGSVISRLDLSAIDTPLWIVAGLVLSALVCGIVATRGGWRGWCLLLFPTLLMTATLISPVASLTDPQWPILFTGGERYFVVPMLCWIALAVYAVSLTSPWMAQLYPVLLLGLTIVLAPHVRMQAVPGPSYRQQIPAFENAPPGARVGFEIAPPGWQMVLIKH